MRHLPRLLTCAYLSALVTGCDGGDDSPPPSPAPAKPAASAQAASTAPPMTVDINKIAADLGAAYKTRATLTAKMTKGQNLDAAECTELYTAMEQCAKISQDICDLLRKTPRWQRQITESLEKNAKSSIIANTKAENAYAKAKKSGRVGAASAPCPANIKALVEKYSMSEMRVKGLMPYTKSEME